MTTLGRRVTCIMTREAALAADLLPIETEPQRTEVHPIAADAAVQAVGLPSIVVPVLGWYRGPVRPWAPGLAMLGFLARGEWPPAALTGKPGITAASLSSRSFVSAPIGPGFQPMDMRR